MSGRVDPEFKFDERSLDSIERIKAQGHEVFPDRTEADMAIEINDLQDEILALEAGQQQASMLYKAMCAGLESRVGQHERSEVEGGQPNDHPSIREGAAVTKREMDMKIAIVVMGYTSSGFGWFHSPKCDGRGNRANAWEGCDFEHHCKEVPQFTTVPYFSKILREKLGGKFFWMFGFGGKKHEKSFGFALYDNAITSEDSEPLFIGEADTEELAVALVALAAYGVEAEIEEEQ